MENDFVSFGKMVRENLGIQCQYAARYCGGFWQEKENYPNLTEGLRISGNSDNYHSLLIHKDDVEEFVKRFKENQKERVKK